MNEAINKQLEELKSKMEALQKQADAESRQEELQLKAQDTVTAALARDPVHSTMKKVTAFLGSIGAGYKIKLRDGIVYSGSLRKTISGEQDQKKPSPVNKYGRGAVTTYVRNIIQGTKPAELVTVPVGEFDQDAVIIAAGKVCGYDWGPGTYTLARTPGGVVVSRNPA